MKISIESRVIKCWGKNAGGDKGQGKPFNTIMFLDVYITFQH